MKAEVVLRMAGVGSTRRVGPPPDLETTVRLREKPRTVWLRWAVVGGASGLVLAVVALVASLAAR